MTSLDWSALAASLAGGLGMGVITRTALRRRAARRHGELAQDQRKRRRIDVVPIDEASGRSSSKRNTNDA